MIPRRATPRCHLRLSPLPAHLLGPGFVMADQQLELYRILVKRSDTAADWYRGALMALADLNNPERFAQAAHSLRELMKKLHIFMEVTPERLVLNFQ